MFLGIHCSVRQGYAAALDEALALGVDAMQILPYARHQTPTPQELAEFKQARERSRIQKLLVHSRYLPALSVTEPRRRAGSQAHLLRELSYAQGLGADAFVLHMGAFSPGSSFGEGVELFVQGLAKAREAGKVLPILIENVPGGGRRMGGNRAELEKILAAVHPVWPEAYLCLDTAHGWAADDDLDAYDPAQVRAWHVNDTLAERGSQRESHWHLGEGLRGAELGALLRRLSTTDTVVILETPKDSGGDAKNLAWARAAAYS